MIRKFSLSLVVVLIVASPGYGEITVSNLIHNSSFNATTTASAISVGQFTTGASEYSLDSLSIGISSNSISMSFVGHLYSDLLGAPGVELEEFGLAVSNGSGIQVVILDAAGTTLLQSGTSYWIGVESTGAGAGGLQTTTNDTEDSTAGWTIGDSHLMRSFNGGASWSSISTNRSAILSIDATSTAVPEPGAVGILGVALIACNLRRRRRHHWKA